MRCPVAVRRGVIEQDTAISAKSRNEFPSASPGKNIVEDNDVFGDGVNVAARLEGLAEPEIAYRRGRADL